MGIKGRTLVIWIALGLALFAGGLDAQEERGRGKLLVLGFASQYINETQDMLLREMVMRDFIRLGYSVVPVMEIEERIQEKSIDVRDTGRARLKNLCVEFSAEYAIAGQIEARRQRLFVSLSLYQKARDQFYSFIIPMGRKSEFQRYAPSLARGIVGKADVLIQGNLK